MIFIGQKQDKKKQETRTEKRQKRTKKQYILDITDPKREETMERDLKLYWFVKFMGNVTDQIHLVSISNICCVCECV